MCERQQARARPACDYLLFQLFPSNHSCEWERKWCVCECVCWFGGGEWGSWREMETFFIPGRKRVGKRELQRNCVNVLVYVQCRCECLLFLWRSQVFFAKWRHCGQRKPVILYMLFLSGSYTQNEVPSAHAPTHSRPIGLAAQHIDWSVSQTQSHKGWPRFQHIHTQAGCKEGYNAHVNVKE